MVLRVKAFFRRWETVAGAVLTTVGVALTGLSKRDEFASLLVPGVAVTVVAGVFTAVTGYRSSRRKRRASLDDILKHYPLPRVGSPVAQEEVGVDRSEIADSYRANDDDWPPYVPRDIDAELDRALLGPGVVVVRGRAKEGKSRTTFEAVRRIPGNPKLAIVQPGESLADLAEIEEPWPAGERVIVWLDKVEPFLRGLGLTPSVRDKLLKHAAVTIVGTIENSLWSAIHAAPDAGTDTQGAAAVLRKATVLHLEEPKPDELKHARERYPREHEFEVGIGQHFVAAARLRAAYDGASSDQTAALRAVADWQLTGMPRWIKHGELKRLCPHYLNGADPARWVAEGMTWANTGLDGSSYRLLEIEERGRGRRRYHTPDHVAEYLAAKRGAGVPLHAWELALKGVDGADEALAVGLRASDEQRWSVAIDGLELACARYPKQSSEFAQAAFRLGQARRYNGDDEAALKAFDDAIDAGHVQAWNLKGYLLMNHDRLPEAERAFTGAIERLNRTAAFNLLEVLSKQGRVDRAEERFRKAVKLGNPAAALMLGMVKHAEGDRAEAERLYEQAAAGTRKVDAAHNKRARMLQALLLADQPEERERAAEMLRAAWDAKEWDRTVERLRHVGLDERLEQLREQLAPAAV